MDCLDQIIGLSQTTCECLTSSLPEGSEEINFNESNSGLFLDELEGFNMNVVEGAADCSNGSVWDIMNRSVETAKKDFKNNILGCIGTKYKPRLQNFHFQLAESSWKKTLTNVSGSYCGQRISPLQLKGGYITVKKIGVLINENAPVTLKIYSNENDGTLIYESSSPLNAIADTLTWGTLATPLELPMWSTSEMFRRYYVVMELNGSFKPKNNKIDCNCSGKAKPWHRWLEVIGCEGSDPSDIDSFRLASMYSNGIVTDVDVKCKMSEVICSDEFPLDFEGDGYALNMAYAIRFRAGALAYETIYNSTQINRMTLMNREYIQRKITEWNTEFQNWVKYLCENVNVDVNDCLICRTNDKSLNKGTILA